MDRTRRQVALALLLLPGAGAGRADGYRAYTDDRPLRLQVTPGHQPTLTTAPRPGVPPFFVIGTDARSDRWLARYRRAFRQAGAVGFVLGAVDRQRVDRLRRGSGIPQLFPLTSDGFLLALGVVHVPVYLDLARGRIGQ